MKKIGFIAVSLLYFCYSLNSQTLSDEQRVFLTTLIEDSRINFKKNVDKLSETTWSTKPVEDKWSVAEISEHLTIALDFLFGISQNALQTAADTSKIKLVEGKEKMILEKMSDRSKKAKAPEVIKPIGQWKSKADLLKAFDEKINKILMYVKSTSDPLNNHFLSTQAFGDLSVYQWLVFCAAHTNRHIDQIKETIMLVGKR